MDNIIRPYYKTKLGELYHGDMRDVLPQIKISSDLLLTDPPYKITARGNSGTSGGMLTHSKSLSGGIFKYNDIDIGDWLPVCLSYLKSDVHLYIMCNHLNLFSYLSVSLENKLFFIKSLIWDKGNKIMGRFYMSQFEYILFFRNGKGIQINNCGTSDILNIPNKKTKGTNKRNIHDTEKPIKLMEILISNSTQENDLVLDPFVGVGATAIAAENLNRRWVAIEKDEEYCEFTAQRIEESRRENLIYGN